MVIAKPGVTRLGFKKSRETAVTGERRLRKGEPRKIAPKAEALGVKRLRRSVPGAKKRRVRRLREIVPRVKRLASWLLPAFFSTC